MKGDDVNIPTRSDERYLCDENYSFYGIYVIWVWLCD